MAAEEFQESRARYKPEGWATEQEGRPPHTSTETVVAVLGFLSAAIEYERPTLSAAATALSMNLRTLQRRLAVDGVSFAGLLDDYRHQRALDLLQAGGVFSVTDIAFKLGYADSAHFTRAFRRWSGCSPREFTAGASAFRSICAESATRIPQRSAERHSAGHSMTGDMGCHQMASEWNSRGCLIGPEA